MISSHPGAVFDPNHSAHRPTTVQELSTIATAGAFGPHRTVACALSRRYHGFESRMRYPLRKSEEQALGPNWNRNGTWEAAPSPCRPWRGRGSRRGWWRGRRNPEVGGPG